MCGAKCGGDNVGRGGLTGRGSAVPVLLLSFLLQAGSDEFLHSFRVQGNN